MFPYKRPANLDRPPLTVIDGGRGRTEPRP